MVLEPMRRQAERDRQLRLRTPFCLVFFCKLRNSRPRAGTIEGNDGVGRGQGACCMGQSLAWFALRWDW